MNLINSVLAISILLLISCAQKVENSKALQVIEEVPIKKFQLNEDVFYSFDQYDSVTFYVNNKTSQKFSFNSKDSILLLDSILVYDGHAFIERPFFKSANNEFLIQTEARFGRVQLIGIDAEGNCSLIQSTSKSSYFDVVVDSNRHAFYTVVTGFGRNPGPFYVYKHNLNEMNTPTDSLTLKSKIVDRLERLRYVMKVLR